MHGGRHPANGQAENIQAGTIAVVNSSPPRTRTCRGCVIAMAPAGARVTPPPTVGMRVAGQTTCKPRSEASGASFSALLTSERVVQPGSREAQAVPISLAPERGSICGFARPAFWVLHSSFPVETFDSHTMYGTVVEGSKCNPGRSVSEHLGNQLQNRRPIPGHGSQPPSETTRE